MILFSVLSRTSGYLNTPGTTEIDWSTRWPDINCAQVHPTLHSRIFSPFFSEEHTLALSLPALFITPLPQKWVLVSQPPLVMLKNQSSLFPNLGTTIHPKTVLPVTRIPRQAPKKTKLLTLPSMPSQFSQIYCHHISGPL